MKPILKIIFPLLIILLITNTVTSDKLEFGFDPNSSDIIVNFSLPQNRESIKIDLRSIALLFCTGVIGLAVFSRRRARSDSDDEDTTSQ